MFVLVAINAKLLVDMGKFINRLLAHLVALSALQLNVLAREFEAGFVMIKSFAVFGCEPTVGDVTLGALFLQEFWAKHANVRALVAILASFRLKLGPIVNSLFQRWLPLDVGVAVFTGDFEMSPIYEVSGLLSVVKIMGRLPRFLVVATQTVIEARYLLRSAIDKKMVILVAR